MTAAEKGTAGKRRRMGSFEHMVAGPVDQGTLAPCKITPKEEDHSLAITTRHAAEFWMIEPEIAFADLQDNMELAEAMLKYVIKYVLEHAPEEMNFFNSFVSCNNHLCDSLTRLYYKRII